ncbi:hypothetical protein SNEBB_009120 [Seison nebaliae]|nr:hypothetical protein SNEBB_009120 [Seison nebaliae]
MKKIKRLKNFCKIPKGKESSKKKKGSEIQKNDDLKLDICLNTSVSETYRRKFEKELNEEISILHNNYLTILDRSVQTEKDLEKDLKCSLFHNLFAPLVTHSQFS